MKFDVSIEVLRREARREQDALSFCPRSQRVFHTYRFGDLTQAIIELEKLQKARKRSEPKNHKDR